VAAGAGVTTGAGVAAGVAAGVSVGAFTGVAAGGAVTAGVTTGALVGAGGATVAADVGVDTVLTGATVGDAAHALRMRAMPTNPAITLDWKRDPGISMVPPACRPSWDGALARSAGPAGPFQRWL
jgi:hypothetical protein